IHPDDRALFQAAVTRSFGVPHSTSHDVRLIEASGHVCPMRLKMKAGRDEIGRPVRLLIAMTEVESEDTRSALLERQAEAERALVERLSVATQAGGIYVWEFDWANRSLRWDPSRIGGQGGNRHRAHELGSEFFNYVHPDDRTAG